MKFLQPTIEKKLTNLLGAKVTFGLLKISPLSGRLEAENMIVAGDAPDRPLLTIRSIDARVAVAKALAGQIAVKSLLIIGPELFLARRSDGSLNLPSRPPKLGANALEESGEESQPWKFEAESIRVQDARIRFQKDDSRVATVEGINCELKCQNGQIDLAAIEFGGKVDVDSWLAAFGPSAIKFPGPVAANVRMSISIPLYAIFPNRKG